MKKLITLQMPIIGDIYKHHSDIEGKEFFKIINFAFDIDKEETVIIYEPLWDSNIKLFCHSLRNFLEVFKDKEGNEMSRYLKVS